VRETLFIADLHLSAQRADTTGLFLRFLGTRARGAEALYILGDLFDTWVGDDFREPPVPEIQSALKRLSQSGTAVFLMHGNRDFLLGPAFAQTSAARLLAEPARIELYGQPTLLMHGDLLCTDDVTYQEFRKRVREPELVRQFLARPLAERIAIAAEYRQRSGEATSLKAQEIMDVSQEAVEHTMRLHRVRRLIHGHTHRPADHQFALGGEQARRLVLAEWHGDRGQLLCASETALRVEDFCG